jgi:hypothetical protein
LSGERVLDRAAGFCHLAPLLASSGPGPELVSYRTDDSGAGAGDTDLGTSRSRTRSPRVRKSLIRPEFAEGLGFEPRVFAHNGFKSRDPFLRSVHASCRAWSVERGAHVEIHVPQRLHHDRQRERIDRTRAPEVTARYLAEKPDESIVGASRDIASAHPQAR